MDITIDRFGEFRAKLGECPRWDTEFGRLWQMDCRVGKIVSLDGDTGKELFRLDVPAPCGSFALNADGSLIVALKDSVAHITPDTRAIQNLAQIENSHPNLRLNDGTAMPDGSFVVGTMHLSREAGEAPLGGLYRICQAGEMHRIETGIAVTNGPCANPLTGRFHVCDSAARVLFSYRIGPDGSLSDKTVFADTSELASAPDGCCFDTEGGLWTALVHAAALVRYDAAGRISHRIELPAAHPAGICFGGSNFDEIFVTTISDSGRLLASGPFDGATLRIRGAGFRGAPQPKARITL